jgi:hypothetical protein
MKRGEGGEKNPFRSKIGNAIDIIGGALVLKPYRRDTENTNLALAYTCIALFSWCPEQ